ncbi:hypothetical protein ABBQ32_012709 [Trebouxia sp. C0010 RCD-2024]
MERRIDTYKPLVPDIKSAAKRAKAEEQREVAKKPMTSWLAGQKLPPVRIIPFRKTNLKMQGWKRWAHLLSRFLPPCGSLCISPKDAQEHFALSAKDLKGIPGCNQKDGKQELAVSRRVFALEDVHVVARRLHKDETGLRAARVAWRQAKARQQAEAGQRRAHPAKVAEQRKKKLLSERFFVHTNLEALRMDVRYHKKRQRSNAKNQPNLVQPHCIGITEPELRAAAEKEELWQLGCQLGFDQVPLGCPSAAVIERVHATDF